MRMQILQHPAPTLEHTIDSSEPFRTSKAFVISFADKTGIVIRTCDTFSFYSPGLYGGPICEIKEVTKSFFQVDSNEMALSMLIDYLKLE